MKKLALLALFIPLTAAADHVIDTPTATYDCAEEPVVTINTRAGGKYTLTGPCDVLNVNGNGHTFTIDLFDVINVNGDKNVITINTLDTVNINGNNNTITVKKKGAHANVVGKGNKVVPPPPKKKK